MRQLYLGFGSNTDREYYLAKGLAALAQRFRLIQVSPVYESDAVGFDGDAFYNFCVQIECQHTVSELKSILKEIEDRCGRDRSAPKYSARTLDIDILYIEDLVGEVDGVRLPRDEVTKNAFVLKPLVDIAPDLIDPRDQQTFSSKWDEYDQQAQPSRDSIFGAV